MIRSIDQTRRFDQLMRRRWRGDNEVTMMMFRIRSIVWIYPKRDKEPSGFSWAGSAERFGPSQLHSHSEVAYWFFTSSESQITDAGHVLLGETGDAAVNQQLRLSSDTQTVRSGASSTHQATNQESDCLSRTWTHHGHLTPAVCLWHQNVTDKWNVSY